jgi:hypothetical protein
VLLLTGAAGSRFRSIAHTGAVMSVELELNIEPKSPPSDAPAIPGTYARAGPPAVAPSPGGVKSARKSRS